MPLAQHPDEGTGIEYHPLYESAGRIKQKTPYGGFLVPVRGSVPNHLPVSGSG